MEKGRKKKEVQWPSVDRSVTLVTQIVKVSLMQLNERRKGKQNLRWLIEMK